MRYELITKKNMSKTKFGAIFMASTMFLSSCTTSYQAASGVTGAMIGARVGETIGFLTGRGYFRGDNAALGSLIGMGVGAALGVGVAATIEKSEKRAYESQYQNDDYQQRDYTYEPTHVQSNFISIADVSYTDGNGDGYISKGETIEIEGYITNKTSDPITDMVINLDVDNTKDFTVSPSLTTSLLPNQRIRYTGRIYCKKARRASQVSVKLNTSLNGQALTHEAIIVPTK